MACRSDILYLIPLSLDHSIRTAAKNGNILKISTVDSTSLRTFFYNKDCTVVYGFRDETRKEVSQQPRKIKPPKKVVETKKLTSSESPNTNWHEEGLRY